MNEQDLQQLDRAHVWHPYTRASTLAGEPLPVIVRGEGIHLVDQHGRRYVDAISSWWCASLGHGHPRIVDAIQRQATRLQHSILANLTHPGAVALATRLARLMPTPDRHVLFASDGASAVEQALKMAIQYAHNTGCPQRRRFACLEDAYHGDTLGAMGVGYLDSWHRPFKPLLVEAVALPTKAPAGSLRFDVWERALAPHATELAAVIVEPLCLGAAGMRMYPAPLLRDLADWCREHDVLLIDDEIAMGFGRTGRRFAFEHAGVDPDIMCLGKALTAGSMPLSATVAKDAIYRSFGEDVRTLQHGHTFCGHPIGVAAALEALAVYDELKIEERAASLGERMARALEPLRANVGVKDVRCLGLIGVVELEAGTETPPRAHRVRVALQTQGILLRPLGNALYLMPPLIIAEAELDALCEAFREAIAAACGPS